MKTVTYEFRKAEVAEIPKGRMHYIECGLEHEATLKFVPRHDFLGLIFNLKDRTNYLFEGEPHNEFPKLHFNFVFVPEGDIDLKLETGQYGWFCMEFHIPYIQAIAGHLPELETNLARITGKSSAFLYDLHRPMTHPMLTSIYDVVYCDFEGELQNQYLESKFVELMILCLGQDGNNGSSIVNDELEKIRAANQYIESHLGFKLEVGYLADMVGLPKHKLEDGFKQVFGTTVSDFVHNEKMKKAIVLLRDTNLGLSDVATALGYTTPASFIRGFKKKFGCTPGQLRKKDDE